MKRLNRVLFPTDFSEPARHALAAALDVASASGAELHLLHVVVLHRFDPAGVDDSLLQLQNEIQASWEKRAAERLRDTADGAGDLRTVTVQQRAVSAADAILEYAGEKEIDLVVMGTHGRRGASHLLLGSTAEEVVRHADCPVLTVRQDSEPRLLTRSERLLVPLDFSEHSRRALHLAQVFAAESGAVLDLLHVVEQLVHPAFYATGKSSLLEVDSELRGRCLDNLQRLAAEAGGPDVKHESHVVEGRAAAEIVRFAEEHRSGGIVIATHGLTGLKHLLLGSVAESVVQRAPCPVLTFKAFGRSFLDR